MRAEILSIGTELLLGRIVNTDAAFIARKLAEIGIDVYHQSTVGDNPARLTESLKKAIKRSDIVITTGGLGPTVDDITIETIARLLNKRLVLNKTVLKDLNEYFKIRKITCPSGGKRQAYIPKGIPWVRNNVGTAPGLIADYKGKVIVCLPGPPRELEPMFDNDVIPHLEQRFGLAHTLHTRTIKITGGAESQVNAKVHDLLKLKPPTTVGIYAKLGEVDLVIMSKSDDETIAQKSIHKIERIIRSRLKDNIFGCDDETLESVVGRLLLKKNKTISVAESCTGGYITHRLTNVSGSSRYVMAGAVTYSNEMKSSILGVPNKLLQKYGAVSKHVAIAMARGMRRLAKTDIGLGITGIAGPTGGTLAKPVGLVYIAFCDGKREIVREMRFRGSREEIKFQASQVALDLIRRNLK